jgi:hypothetical protein
MALSPTGKLPIANHNARQPFFDARLPHAAPENLSRSGKRLKNWEIQCFC